MGLFDTVYVSGDVAAAWGLRCNACGRTAEPGWEWQTKSLDPCMWHYYLRHDASGAIRLYALDQPSDRRFWRAWSDEEIAESRRRASERGGLFSLWVNEPGGGRFLPEAYLPENRRQRFMGELPHQWVETGARCPCGGFTDLAIKFTDGVATERTEKVPYYQREEESDPPSTLQTEST